MRRLRKLFHSFVFLFFTLFTFFTHSLAVIATGTGTAAGVIIGTAIVAAGSVIKSVLVDKDDRAKTVLSNNDNSDVCLELKKMQVTNKGEICCLGEAKVIHKPSSAENTYGIESVTQRENALKKTLTSAVATHLPSKIKDAFEVETHATSRDGISHDVAIVLKPKRTLTNAKDPSPLLNAHNFVVPSQVTFEGNPASSHSSPSVSVQRIDQTLHVSFNFGAPATSTNPMADFLRPPSLGGSYPKPVLYDIDSLFWGKGLNVDYYRTFAELGKNKIYETLKNKEKEVVKKAIKGAEVLLDHLDKDDRFRRTTATLQNFGKFKRQPKHKDETNYLSWTWELLKYAITSQGWKSSVVIFAKSFKEEAKQALSYIEKGEVNARKEAKKIAQARLEQERIELLREAEAILKTCLADQSYIDVEEKEFQSTQNGLTTGASPGGKPPWDPKNAHDFLDVAVSLASYAQKKGLSEEAQLINEFTNMICIMSEFGTGGAIGFARGQLLIYGYAKILSILAQLHPVAAGLFLTTSLGIGGYYAIRGIYELTSSERCVSQEVSVWLRSLTPREAGKIFGEVGAIFLYPALKNKLSKLKNWNRFEKQLGETCTKACSRMKNLLKEGFFEHEMLQNNNRLSEAFLSIFNTAESKAVAAVGNKTQVLKRAAKFARRNPKLTKFSKNPIEATIKTVEVQAELVNRGICSFFDKTMLNSGTELTFEMGGIGFIGKTSEIITYGKKVLPQIFSDRAKSRLMNEAVTFAKKSPKTIRVYGGLGDRVKALFEAQNKTYFWANELKKSDNPLCQKLAINILEAPRIFDKTVKILNQYFAPPKFDNYLDKIIIKFRQSRIGENFVMRLRRLGPNFKGLNTNEERVLKNMSIKKLDRSIAETVVTQSEYEALAEGLFNNIKDIRPLTNKNGVIGKTVSRIIDGKHIRHQLRFPQTKPYSPSEKIFNLEVLQLINSKTLEPVSARIHPNKILHKWIPVVNHHIKIVNQHGRGKNG